ncbi:hypothetical protein [Streptomyces physcomitrii]|uniref:Uncharacterized protein n=1 Tax=Streptomyces physcomitrii TaxID=2724184 RepID=A0ABX1H2L2_9ACTN|nr:hypothetical protein [Streptomyces physcomitrii]NKI42594.1 hypothetical protein [Streptomyces physcomitrii]
MRRGRGRGGRPNAVEAATDGSLTMAGGALGVLLLAEHARSARRTESLEAGPQGDS